MVTLFAKVFYPLIRVLLANLETTVITDGSFRFIERLLWECKTLRKLPENTLIGKIYVNGEELDGSNLYRIVPNF